MSWQAMAWVATLPPEEMNLAGVDRFDGLTYAEYRVLLVLADAADEYGYAAYPSRRTMAAQIGCTVRTVSRSLLRLAHVGLIRVGDQGRVSAFPANRRPTVYDVLTPALRSNEGTQPGVTSNVLPFKSRGDTQSPLGVTSNVPQTSLNPPYQDLTDHPPLVTVSAREETS